MAKPILFLYVGAHRLQAAWAPGASAAAQLLFDSELQWSASQVDNASVQSESFAELLLACSATPALLRGFMAHVLMSDYWVPCAALPWDARQLHAESAMAAARDQIRDEGHDLTSRDIIRIDDAPFRQPRLVVAYPHELVAQVEDMVRRANGTLRSIGTLAAMAWRGIDTPAGKGKDSDQLLAIIEPAGPGMATVALARSLRGSECLDEIVTRPLPASNHGLAQEPEIKIQALLERLEWLDSAAPESVEAPAWNVEVIDFAAHTTNISLPPVLAWWTEAPHRPLGETVDALDGVARTASASMFRSLLLCMVIATTGLLSWNLWRSEARLHQDRSVEHLAYRDKPLRVPPTVQELRRIVAINAAVAELNVPLPRLLRALEPPRDILVALLGIEVAARSGSGVQAAGAGPSRSTLRVHLESPSSLDMTRYVALLAGRKPFVQAYLARHEVLDRAREAQETAPAQGQAPYRFTVEVIWEDPL